MIIEGQIVSKVEVRNIATGSRKATFIIDTGKKRIACKAWKDIAQEVEEKVHYGETHGFKGFMADDENEFIIQNVLSASVPPKDYKKYIYQGFETKEEYREFKRERETLMLKKNIVKDYIIEVQPGVWASVWDRKCN